MILGIHMLTISPVSDNISLAAGSVKGRTKPSIFKALVGWFRLEWEVVRGRGSAGRSLVGVGRGSLVGGKAGVPDPSPLLLHACYSPLTCRYVSSESTTLLCLSAQWKPLQVHAVLWKHRHWQCKDAMQNRHQRRKHPASSAC